MRHILCALAIVIAGMPAPVFAADAPTNEQLRKRLQDLDRRIERLERREKAETKAERKAEERKAARKADAKAAAARKEPTKADWAKVTYNMSEDQVIAILGKPLATKSERQYRIWSYSSTGRGGEVWFENREVQRVIPPQ